MSDPTLRVGVAGAGAMGADHIRRLRRAVSGCTVAAVIEPDEARRAAALTRAPGAAGFSRIEDALDAGVLDAVVVAAPGPVHEAVLHPVLEARLPVLCEKPLTPEPESSLRLVEAEIAVGRRLIQVGFMRRFDDGYGQLKALIDGGSVGELLLLHCAHRNPSTTPGYRQQMLITDSVVHEFDAAAWLAGASITAVEVRYGRPNRRSRPGLREPVLVLIELSDGVLVDVEMSVSAGFGYQVVTEAVFERSVVRIGEAIERDHRARFARAYDGQLRSWADAARRGGATGPSAWDGYRAAVACAAGVRALAGEGRVAVDLPAVPPLYA